MNAALPRVIKAGVDRPRGSGGPASGAERGAELEATFYTNVRATVAGWVRRLAASPAESAAIGQEAAALANVARGRGAVGLVAPLVAVQQASQGPIANLVRSVHDLAQTLAMMPGAGPAAPGPVAGGKTVRMNVEEAVRGGLVGGPPSSPPGKAPSDVPPPLLSDSIAPPPLIPAAGPPPRGGDRTVLLNPSATPAPPSPAIGAKSRAPAVGMGDSQKVGGEAAPPKLLVKNILIHRKAFTGSGAAVPDPSAIPGGMSGGASRGPGPSESLGAVPKLPAFSESMEPPLPGRMPPLAIPSPLPTPSPPWGSKGRGSGSSRGSRDAPPRGRSGRRDAIPVWAYVIGGAIVFLGLCIGLLVLLVRPHKSDADARVDGGSADNRSASGGGDSNKTTDDAAGPPRSISMGEQSPQLRQLIEREGTDAAKCRTDPSKCWRWKAGTTTVDSGGPTALPPSLDLSLHDTWVRRLRMPRDFPSWDDGVVKGFFDSGAYTITGHENFQTSLRRCSAYRDIIDAKLEKYQAPKWLFAVVFQESGCSPSATSPVGATGLWQLMSQTARLYDLDVVEDEIDERLNPLKETEAGVRFLVDLWRVFRSWDLALAAYNMGPYGLAQRIQRVGGHATFWDLRRAGMLPEETANYVPAIEAFALMDENATQLNFRSNEGLRSESTAELPVTPGIRLSLIARAARTSTASIRQLNPEFLGPNVTPGKRKVRIPFEPDVPNALQFLKDYKNDDNWDSCVPDDFDWGGRVAFDPSKYPNCKPRTLR